MRLIPLLFILVSCAAPDTRDQQFQTFNHEINAMRDLKQVTYVEGQKRKYAKVMALWPGEPTAGEFFSYTIMLGEKVDSGKLSPAEYEYLAIQKHNEINERVSNSRVGRAQAAAAIMSVPSFQNTK